MAPQSSPDADAQMQTLGRVQGCVWCWWLDQGFGKAPLILSAQAEDRLLRNGSLGRVVGCTHDEIREAAPLQLSRPLQSGLHAWR